MLTPLSFKGSRLDPVTETYWNQIEQNTKTGIATLVAYEAVLTLPREVQYIWRQKARLHVIAFMVLKYSTILVHVMDMVTTFKPYTTDKDCFTGMLVQNILQFTRDIIFPLLLLLRCVAIWNRSIMVGATLGGLWLSIAAADAIRYRFWGLRAYPAPYGGCEFVVGDPLIDVTSPAIFTYLIGVFDTTVVVLTASRTAKLAIQARRLKIHKPISFYVLRDGILYFVLIDVLVLFISVTETVELKSGTVVSPWPLLMTENTIERYQQAVASLAVQRLVLNLRQVSDAQANPDEIMKSLGKLDFAHGSILGNIGAPLATDDVEDNDNIEDGSVASGTSSNAPLELAGEDVDLERSQPQNDLGIEEVTRE